MIPHAFGQSDSWTVGIEEELFVLDAETLAPAAFPREELDGVRFKAELFASLLELNTGVCASVDEAAAQLVDLRTEAKRRAGAAGLVLGAAGTWPIGVPEEQPVVPEKRYLEFVDYAGPSARRQLCCGLHVHVGMRSPDACMEALEGVLPWLPVVLAVSANSPYLAGRATGLASTRAETLALLPRSGAPPAFRSYAEWERFVERLTRLGLVREKPYTSVYWDARPHPRYGTLEIRVPDQPTRPEVTAAFGALLQALAADASADGRADRGIYQQNRWAALRFGPGAGLIHPDGSRLVPAHELLDELLERLDPTARRLGGAHLLGPLRGLDQATEQLEVGERAGVGAVCERLVALT